AAGYNFIYGKFGFITNLMVNIWPDMNRDWFSGYFAVVFVMTFATPPATTSSTGNSASSRI
ncbi:hypothetical protein CTI14_69470, partial [Methylobacterium radiotolerans]